MQGVKGKLEDAEVWVVAVYLRDLAKNRRHARRPKGVESRIPNPECSILYVVEFRRRPRRKRRADWRPRRAGDCRALHSAWAAVADPVKTESGQLSGADTATPSARAFKGFVCRSADGDNGGVALQLVAKWDAPQSRRVGCPRLANAGAGRGGGGRRQATRRRRTWRAGAAPGAPGGATPGGRSAHLVAPLARLVPLVLRAVVVRTTRAAPGGAQRGCPAAAAPAAPATRLPPRARRGRGRLSVPERVDEC